MLVLDRGLRIAMATSQKLQKRDREQPSGNTSSLFLKLGLVVTLDLVFDLGFGLLLRTGWLGATGSLGGSSGNRTRLACTAVEGEDVLGDLLAPLVIELIIGQKEVEDYDGVSKDCLRCCTNVQDGQLTADFLRAGRPSLASSSDTASIILLTSAALSTYCTMRRRSLSVQGPSPLVSALAGLSLSMSLDMTSGIEVVTRRSDERYRLEQEWRKPTS